LYRKVVFSAKAITDVNGLLEIENAWNEFIRDRVESPFLLSEFTKELIKVNLEEGWTPMLLVFSVDSVIIGIAPLAIKTKFGVRRAKFLLPSAGFPDFVLDVRYRAMCIDKICNLLFGRMKCQFATLTLPQESANLESLKNQRNLLVSETPAMGHRILPVRGTWAEFETFRGRNFRRKFKGIERNLDRFGSWRISCIENGKEEFNVVKKIFDIEKMSWKEELRVRTGKKDTDLLILLEGSQHMVEIEPGFKWDVWFLELNNQAIAYSLFIEYKGVSYCVKTSYDRRYKRLYPGIYVINAALCEFFNKHQIREIDFLTDLPFHETWTSLCSPRVRIVMARSSVLLSMAKFALLSKPVKGILTLLSKRAPSMADLIGL
jgi:hypothetical protein